MNILNWFFEKINPEGRTNWLSKKYAWWYYSRRDKRNREFIKNPHVPIESFEVAGAGNVCLSKNPCHLTGQSYGFGFYVSWGKNSYSGGILGLEEAKRMAEFIIEKYNEQPKREADLVSERYRHIGIDIPLNTNNNDR